MAMVIVITGNYNYENISDYNGTANSDYSYYN